ncbi:MAG: sigma 54-dependent Fis family transcriptional regulator [Candidatus Hydrogenedentes bacterium]|nr:sigma 54-dependent Fis family transcriptional regulator [Candidatus Hydrogenedentota bacterium]
MDVKLASTAGKCRGACWGVGAGDVVVGRGADCDIVLLDPAVSRRHCRIVREGTDIWLEDLGSRNPALLNGAPVRRARLEPGDEISIGTNQFLVLGEGEGAGQGRVSGASRCDTVSWSESLPITLALDSARAGIQARPGTVDDLVFLFDVAREAGVCRDVKSLLALLRERLCQRFDPVDLWVALVHGRDTLNLVVGAEQTSPPLDLMHTCLREGHGMLAPGTMQRGKQKVRTFTLAAPLTVSEADIGAIVLRTELPHASSSYDEADLRLLVLLAQSLAPIICAIENQEQLRRDNERLRARSGESLELVGDSSAIRRVRLQIAQAAASNLNVIITGETGTGKELAARLVHVQSVQRAEPFVVVNCAAIPRDLFESEFFGYERGAFTGATHRFDGLLAQAHGGTLFLDEVADLSLENQARILRAVEDGAFRRVGGKEEIRVRVRIVAATNKDLRKALAAGQFREDLFHRLTGFEIRIPPLRERPSDIPDLVEHFFQLIKNQAKRPLSGYTPETLIYLQKRSWPGNVRELRNWMLRAVALATSEWIHPEMSIEEPSQTIKAAGATKPALSLAEVERRHITSVLQQCGGSIKETARILQVARSTLYARIAQYDIK